MNGVDVSVGSFASSLRIKLFKEHLGLLQKPLAGIVDCPSEEIIDLPSEENIDLSPEEIVDLSPDEIVDHSSEKNVELPSEEISASTDVDRPSIDSLVHDSPSKEIVVPKSICVMDPICDAFYQVLVLIFLI